MKKIFINTRAEMELINITDQVQTALIDESGSDGMYMIYVPHTTAGVTINENADPSVEHDILHQLAVMAPRLADYTHMEGNSAAHIKASLVGSSALVIVERGRLQLGTWQGVFFCEFDGPRERHIWLQFLGEAR